MRKFYVAVLALCSMKAVAQNPVKTITDADLGSGEYTWSSDTTYMLDGFVFLEEGGNLNIEAGTVIKAKSSPSNADNATALVITRGAMIHAIGTANEPIIFTSELDDFDGTLTEFDRGLWGGMIILGSAKIADKTDTSAVEGIPSDEVRAKFGGTNDADSSGVLQYVSIRHGGAALSLDNEINGLTLGAVGSKTVIDHVEIFANLDDGIEWFGGTVSAKYMAVSFCGDDGYDYDLGWRGNGQFWFAMVGADEGDNAGEHDGGKPDDHELHSTPTIYNATYIGSGAGANAKNSTAVLMRDGTAGIYANSIFTDFKGHALEVEDRAAEVGEDSRTHMQGGSLKFMNNMWHGFGDRTELSADATNGFLRATDDAEDAAAQFLIDHLTNNNNEVIDPVLASISRVPNSELDPRASAAEAWANLADIPASDWFTTVEHKGAFGAENWMEGWTALDSYGFFGDLWNGVIGREDVVSVSSMMIFPSPANASAKLVLNMEVATDLNLSILDITGKVVADQGLVNTKAGSNVIDLEVNGLSNGLYFVSVQKGTATQVSKLLIRK